MLDQYDNILAKLKGVEVRLSVESYSRGGSKSPYLHILIYQGVRYSPYKAKRAGLTLTIHSFLQMCYGSDNFRDLIMKDNPFLAIIPKNESFLGALLAVPKYEKP